MRDLTLALMTDPVYIIDSLTLFATSSPEGNWRINGEIARKRAESIRNILVRDFTQLYDSLSVGAAMEIDDAGNIRKREVKDEIPNLPQLIKVRTIPEGWDKLRRLIMEDEHFVGNRGAVLRIIDKETDPDRREWLIKSQYKAEYAYMLDKLYPSVRAVDFRFTLPAGVCSRIRCIPPNRIRRMHGEWSVWRNANMRRHWKFCVRTRT